MFKKLIESTKDSNKGVFEKKHLKDHDIGTQDPETLKNPSKKEVSQAVQESLIISGVAAGLLTACVRTS